VTTTCVAPECTVIGNEAGPFTVNWTVTVWDSSGDVLEAVTVTEIVPLGVVRRVGTESVTDVDPVIEFGETVQVTPVGHPAVTARLTVVLSVAEY